MVSSVGYSSSASLIQCMQTSQFLTADGNLQIDTPMPFNPNEKLNPNDEQIAAAQEEFQEIYDELINSWSFKPNSKEEFFQALTINMSLSSGNLTDSDFMYKSSACNDLLSSLDIDAEFDKFLESRGCANVDELQALNKTMFRSTEELRYFSEAKLRGQLSNLDKDKVPYAMSTAKRLVSGVDIGTLSKYLSSNNYDSAKMAYGFICNYSGGEINVNELSAIQKEFDTYLQILENKEKQAQKNINPAEQLKTVDYSKYDDKYGERYEQSLVLNYEE